MSLLGVQLVFWRHIRVRCAWQDLLIALFLFLSLLVATQCLEGQGVTPNEYSGVTAPLLARWLTRLPLCAALLLPLIGAVLGASAVPPREQFEMVQTALLTRLTAFDLCLGRLMAALWPLTSATLLTLAFGLTLQVGWHPIEGVGEGYGTILLAHLLVLSAIWMAGCIGLLAATRRRPGRRWGRGAGVALAWIAFCLMAFLLANPLIVRLDQPAPLINLTLLLNPVLAVSTTFDNDLLRTDVLYPLTDIPQYPFIYPSPLLSLGLFVLIGGAALLVAATLTRRAYR